MPPSLFRLHMRTQHAKRGRETGARCPAVTVEGATSLREGKPGCEWKATVTAVMKLDRRRPEESASVVARRALLFPSLLWLPIDGPNPGIWRERERGGGPALLPPSADRVPLVQPVLRDLYSISFYSRHN